MAASGCVEAKGSAGELNNLLVAKTLLENGVFDHAFNFDQNSTVCAQANDQCLARCWNGGYRPATNNKVDIVNLLQQTPAPLTLRAGLQNDTKHHQNSVFHCERRTLRIERAGSTESVVATSGESCQSSSIGSDSASEPSSPSRPVTPPPMPPVPAHLTDHCPYECLRADSEDSGLGPSPAKSSMGPTSPLEGYVSPIQFVPEAEDEDDDEPNSLLDLTTCRGKASYIKCKEDSFLPYTVSKLIGQEKDINGLCQRANGRNDTFHFCLPRVNSQNVLNGLQCEGRSPSDIPQNCGLEQSTRNALDFQFLMTSKSVGGSLNQSTGAIVPSDANCRVQELSSAASAAEDNPCRPELLLSSPANSSSSIEKAVGSLPHSPSSSVTKVDTNAKYSSNSNLSPRHKVPPDAKSDYKSSFMDPKDALVRREYTASDSSKRDVDCDESRQSSCGDTSQDRSEMCHDLTSDCTSSSCSQVTNDTQSSSSSSGGAPDDNTCKWLNCDQKADANTNSSDLVDHLRKCHVQSQFDDGRSYVCLWVGCKVYDRPSSSRSWLERHVLLHGGSKPFRCIVDGCHQRFGTEGALQRHVNSHFPQSSRNGKAGPHGDHHAGGAGGSGGPNGRLLKRKRHHKYRRRPHSVKTNDFFDDGIMEIVRHSLLELSSIEGMDRAGPPAAITFHSTVIARRTEGSGKTKLLLHWDPEDLLPDSWVAEEDAPSSFQKTIPISSLPPEMLVHLDPVYATRLLPRPGKRRRK